MAATTEEVPQPSGRGTSSVVSFVAAMDRVDVLELVVDLVDLDLDVDLVDVDLAVLLCDGPRSVLFSFGLVAPTCFGFLFELLKTLKLSFDALDRLYRPECDGFLGTVSNNSFKKH